MKTLIAKRISPSGQDDSSCTSDNGLDRTLENGSRPLSIVALTLPLQNLAAALNEAERRERDQCEVIIGKGWDTFLDVGQALATVRDKRLYRDHHRTFEEYCRQKWEFSKSHANRLIEAAVVVSVLTPIGVKPTSESQLRPLVGLSPQKIPEAWKKAEELAGNGKVTAKVVRLAAEEFKPDTRQRRKTTISNKPVVKRTALNVALRLIEGLEKSVRRKDTKAVLKGLRNLHETLLSWLPTQPGAE
jgi:hypothetical protein